MIITDFFIFLKPEMVQADDEEILEDITRIEELCQGQVLTDAEVKLYCVKCQNPPFPLPPVRICYITFHSINVQISCRDGDFKFPSIVNGLFFILCNVM